MLTTLLAFVLAAQTTQSVEQLAWMSGCWESTRGATHSTEQWTRPEGRTMLATSRTVKDGVTVAYEFVRIWQDDSGAIFYTAKPSGQAEASFKLVKLSDREAVFENPAHDFPQRIIYRLGDAGRLAARIEGTRNGQLRGVDFPMTRAACN